MNAAQFNERYPVGYIFLHCHKDTGRAKNYVATVAPARDFECGCIVEINKAPYFAKVEALKKVGP